MKMNTDAIRNYARLWTAAVVATVTLTLSSHPPVFADTFKIEIDYMVGTNHSHEPSDAVLVAVVQMFACQGHTLILNKNTANNVLPHYVTLRRDPANCITFFDYDGVNASFGAIRDAYRDKSPANGWHYCVIGHQYENTSCTQSGSSGLAEMPGWNLLVSLGNFDGNTGTEFEQAATLAHEFGHNLGLSHCGTMICPATNNGPSWVGPFSPNLPSIMSYRYQLSGLRTTLECFGLATENALFKEMDYSHGRMCSLNEISLSEPRGTQMDSVDWNCDDLVQVNVSQDINGGGAGWCGSAGNTTWLTDYDEWANIADPPPPQENSGHAPEVIECITAEQVARMKEEFMMMGGGCDEPVLSTESCISGQNVYLGVQAGAQVGTCASPYASVQAAHDGAPDDSVFYFRSSTYDEPGVVTLSNPGLYLANTGSAVIR
jgi:hypothetical protein